MTTCPTPVTGYTDAAGNVTIPRAAVAPLLDAAIEWHESCDPADMTCPSNLVRALLRDAISAGGQAADVVFVDADVTPGANYVTAEMCSGSCDACGWSSKGTCMLVEESSARHERLTGHVVTLDPRWGEHVDRPSLSGHVHLRTDGRCLHNHGGDLCGRIL